MINKQLTPQIPAFANGHSQSQGVARPPSRLPPKSQGYDWLGAILRRKGILIFVLAVSTIAGYLYHIRQPKVYASTLKMMIFTNVPPKMATSEGVVQQASSTGKHQNLLKSELVLAKAVTVGQLGSLPTFSGHPEPYYALRGMVKVEPIGDAADTLVLTATGPNPKDLPLILTAVVSSYQDVLSEDEQAIGKSWVELIQKLEGELAEKKSTSETEYFALVQKLGLAPDLETKQFTNPHMARVEELKQLKANNERELREVQGRISGVNAVKDQPVEKQKIIAIEAYKYLQLGTEQFRTTGSIGIGASDIEETQTFIQQLSRRIDSLESELNEIRLKAQKARRTYGDSHPGLLSLSADLDFKLALLTSLREQRKLMQSKIGVVAKVKTAENDDTMNMLSDQENFLIRTYLATLDHEADGLSDSIDRYGVELAAAEAEAVNLSGSIEKLNVLATDIDQKGSAIASIVDKLSELTVMTSNHTTTKVRVIDSPGVGYQVGQKLSSTMILFLFSGGILGLGIVALLDWTDMSYRNPEEIKEKLGLQVLARIPKMSEVGIRKHGRSDCLVTLDKPKSAVSEAYRACRTAMLFMAKQQNMKCFLVTSPSAGDGKSTTAMNLAMCFAQGNLKTVIVDADLRRPRCHENLGVSASPGIKDLSTGDATVEQIVRASDLHPNLSVITAGKQFANPASYLDSAQFEALIQHLRDNFDIVIIDSPPVLPVADSLALSVLCDGALLVLRIRKGVVVSSTKAVDMMRTVNANLVGVVVNQVDKVSNYSDYGKYGYGGYFYYAGRYYDKQNDKYYDSEEDGSEGNSDPAGRSKTRSQKK